MLIDHPITYQQLTERTEADIRAYLTCATTAAESSVCIALQASARSLFVQWLSFANRLRATLDDCHHPALEAEQARLLADATSPGEPMTRACAMVPAEVGELEAAGLRYASLNPADSVDNTLSVEVATLRRLGMIATDMAVQVPASCMIRVIRDEADALRARVMWPCQLQQDRS